MSSRPHVAVIGAGLAGLSCALRLQEAGHRVTVFDKSRGVAGRMSTRRNDAWQCDHGAQYFTARSAEFQAELARWVEAGVAALWTPRLQVFGGLAAHSPDQELQRWVGAPMMTAPAQWLAQGLQVHKEAQVSGLLREGQGWRLCGTESVTGGEAFDRVVLAVPAPQAAALLADCAPAQSLAAQAAAVRMRGCWALMLSYAQPLDLGYDAAFVNAGPLRWVARNSSKPGRSGAETWLLHAEAEWSEQRLALPAEAVAAQMLQAFADLGGPAPATWVTHRWLYADTAPEGQAAALSKPGYLWVPELALGLCGDWLNGGKVEGAYLSGRQLAEQVLA
ncbi:NAD(P)/FAD-dependent oxidoreductase [Paucibacter sp. Y2R2-4]|uniref:NAD(P)/FAD-dependent oxidoreductase n=1 Tax=Paucibacter sp. Y2R2-4 TaxID=2893553 RepID=UPI0021E40A01|nr:FAD-dependent oxidoreductase [Paucibacter sp. Y2R2-4]MCV2350963.1 FAD-dependent oxidoreductase [Paucibacter sp. Y2R2-4]